MRGAQGEVDLVVGFADLVGFTALSQQVTDRELAAIVDQFETLAYDVITTEGGRVVKMIGDEVMFVVESPEAAAEIALSLADASREADELSDVRVGMAVGPVLEREGDCFGPTVNLASRITSIAFPGSVIVSSDLHERLADHEEYAWRSMRPRQLKNIGRVHLWVLRRATEGFESRFAEGRRALREAVRARIDTSGDANATT
jgi:adenylate cyclase